VSNPTPDDWGYSRFVNDGDIINRMQKDNTTETYRNEYLMLLEILARLKRLEERLAE